MTELGSKEKQNTRYYYYGLGILLFLVFLWGFYDLLFVSTNWARVSSFATIRRTLFRFIPPEWGYILTLGKATVDTVLIAILGTSLAMVLSLPVIWFAARNITPFFPITYPIGRFFMTISRSVHEIIWALIFVSAMGLGPLPGILALSVRSIGFTAKLMAEQVENIDYRPVEAILAVGGNGFDVFWYGMVPQVLPLFIGTLIFQADINLRRATIIGIVGAGGIGLLFSLKMMSYLYARASAILVVIFFLVACGEILSTKLRKKYV